MKKNHKDPVCGMDVDEYNSSHSYKGKTYYFCSKGCHEKFQKNAVAYLSKTRYDLIIVGAGPAGLTAGVYASILKMDTLLLSTDIGGQAVDSTKIKNYMGFDFITGPELSSKFKDQLLHEHYIDHKLETVKIVKKKNGYFVIQAYSGREYQSKALIIATGMVRRNLGVPGEKKFKRKGICYAAGQDVPLMAGKKVAVIGGGNSALQIVLELYKHNCEILLVSLEPLSGDPNLIEEVQAIKRLTFLEYRSVKKIEGQETIEKIFVKDLSTEKESEFEVEAVFVAIGLSPNSSLVQNLVEMNSKREIQIEGNCNTGTPGLFAAGDVTDVFAKRIIIASGEGAKAAIAVKKYLLDLKE